MRSKPIVVAGGAGYIGSHFCHVAAERGFSPIVVDSIGPCTERVAAYRRSAAGRFQLEVCDIGDEARVGRLLARHRPVAAVCFAALIDVAQSVADPGLYWDYNYLRPMRFFRALAAGGVRHLVFSSTAAVYGSASGAAELAEDDPLDPASPYGLTKLACELMLQGASGCHRLAPDVRFDGARGRLAAAAVGSGLAAGAFAGLSSLALRYFNAAGAHPAAGLGEVHDPETHLIPRALAAALAPSERGRAHHQRRRLPHRRWHLRARLCARPGSGRGPCRGHRVPARRRSERRRQPGQRIGLQHPPGRLRHRAGDRAAGRRADRPAPRRRSRAPRRRHRQGGAGCWAGARAAIWTRSSPPPPSSTAATASLDPAPASSKSWS